MLRTGHPKPVHWDNPEGWGDEGGEGVWFRVGGHITYVPVADSC